MNEIVQKIDSSLIPAHNDQAVTAFSSQYGFEAAQRMANALCSSTMVPKQYQGQENIGNTIIALELAQRIDASPLMVMQNLYLVHGRPGWSSKYLIATFNQCGRFSAIRYEWKGTAGEKDRACRAYAYEKQTNDKLEGPWIDWKLIESEGWNKKQGSKWLTMPEKMFMYRAAGWFIDTVAPELSMGIPPADQLDDIDIIDITPESNSEASNLNEAISKAKSDTEKPKTEKPADEKPKPEKPKRGPGRPKKSETAQELKPDQETAQQETTAPPATYAEIMDAINNAKNVAQAVKAVASNIIGHLPAGQQEELLEMSSMKQNMLANPEI